MRTIMILALSAWSLWSWGGEPVNLSQQRLDAIFPVQPTDAEVRQHTVRITIEPPRYRTESTLTLYNPKNEPETLTLVVPLLEEVVFTEHAVRFRRTPARMAIFTFVAGCGGHPAPNAACLSATLE